MTQELDTEKIYKHFNIDESSIHQPFYYSDDNGKEMFLGNIELESENARLKDKTVNLEFMYDVEKYKFNELYKIVSETGNKYLLEIWSDRLFKHITGEKE